MIPVQYYVLLSAILFTIGSVGFLVRRNLIFALMSIELMLNAANLALVAFNRAHAPTHSHSGQIFAFFVIAVAAAESSVGLALVIALYRLKRTVRSDDADLLRN